MRVIHLRLIKRRERSEQNPRVTMLHNNGGRGLATLLILTTALLLTCLQTSQAGMIEPCVFSGTLWWRAFLTVIDFFLVFAGEVCASHQFECASGHCIPFTWTCDGEDDCGDGSDENQSCRGEIEIYCVTGSCMVSRLLFFNKKKTSAFNAICTQRHLMSSHQINMEG